MVKLKNFKILKKAITDNESDDSSTIEIKPKKETIYKMKKERAPYVFTDARKEAFEKARTIREQRRDERKLKKQEDEENKKKELEDKIVKKAEIIKKKTAKKEKILDTINDDKDNDETVIIQKVKKPKKKVIIVESDSDDEVIVRKKTKPKPAASPLARLQPVQSQPQSQPVKRFVPVYY
jgi:hypothetical protein